MQSKLSSVRLVGGYAIELTYADGVSGTIDFSDHVGKGVFQKWQDRASFETVHIGEHGQLAWDEDIDFCPDALYLELTGKKPEDLFPNLASVRA